VWGDPGEDYRTWGGHLHLGSQAGRGVSTTAGRGALYLGSQARRGVPHNPGGVSYIWGVRKVEWSLITRGGIPYI